MDFVKKGDYIDIIEPSYYITDSRVDAIVKYIEEKLQLRINNKDDLYNKQYLSFRGNDKQRAQQLIDAMANSKTKLIWSLKGGYGATRLLDYIFRNGLEKELCHTHPKLLLGFSDTTALHIFAEQGYNYHAVHAPLLFQITEDLIVSESVAMVEDFIFGRKQCIEYSLSTIYCPHDYEIHNIGVVGGNLTLIVASIGTQWQIDARNKILFFEDIGESPTGFDRDLRQLSANGLLDHVECMILGDLYAIAHPVQEYKDILVDFCKSHDIVLFHNEHLGHGKISHTLPFNMPASIAQDSNGNYKLTVACRNSKC